MPCGAEEWAVMAEGSTKGLKQSSLDVEYERYCFDQSTGGSNCVGFYLFVFCFRLPTDEPKTVNGRP